MDPSDGMARCLPVGSIQNRRTESDVVFLKVAQSPPSLITMLRNLPVRSPAFVYLSVKNDVHPPRVLTIQTSPCLSTSFPEDMKTVSIARTKRRLGTCLTYKKTPHLQKKCRGASLTKKRNPLGTYCRPMPRVLGGS